MLSDNLKEYKQSELKKNGFEQRNEFDGKIKTILKKNEILDDNSQGFSKSLNHYVQVKSYDKDKKEYTCKIMKTDGSAP